MFNQVLGDWPKDNKFILCSCDEKYFNKYFPRFYKTFTEYWKLPIHVHIIDPSKKSIERVKNIDVSYTWCETNDYNWGKAIMKYRERNSVPDDKTDAEIRQWLYECYCQCQRFILLGNNMKKEQSVVVADVDAYAQYTPTKARRNELFSATAFTEFKGRLMATFCHFHPRNLLQIKQLGTMIRSQLKRTFILGMDQVALRDVFIGSQDIIDLKHGKWIRHWDIKEQTDIEAHAECIIYHAKGSRGKINPVGVKWTDIK